MSSHWQIMGGEDVRVWVDRWLPSLPFGHPTPTGEAAVTKNLRVSSLIASSANNWNIDFMLPFLSMDDQHAILEMPIGDLSRKDRLVWAATKNGLYSVKSRYPCLQLKSLEVRDTRFLGVRLVPKALWNLIWRLEVPPKLRHFLWISLHQGLPSRVVLYKRRLSNSLTCPLCLSNDESVEHIFLECPWVKVIWFVVLLIIKLISLVFICGFCGCSRFCLTWGPLLIGNGFKLILFLPVGIFGKPGVILFLTKSPLIIIGCSSPFLMLWGLFSLR